MSTDMWGRPPGGRGHDRRTVAIYRRAAVITEERGCVQAHGDNYRREVMICDGGGSLPTSKDEYPTSGDDSPRDGGEYQRMVTVDGRGRIPAGGGDYRRAETNCSEQ